MILLINPPIYDFAAFDLWSKPLALLYLSAILKKQGVNTVLLDFMDRGFKNQNVSRETIAQKNGRYGCGHYIKAKAQKPECIKNIPRNYCRYGILKEDAIRFLKNQEKPEFIIITSIMTYWYQGVLEALEIARELFPDIPIVIGGVYAALCFEHLSKHIKNVSCETIALKGSLFALNAVFKEKGIAAQIPASFADYPAPDFSHYQNNQYAVLRMSLGCPFSCSYCAQNILNDGQFISKQPQKVFKEIEGFVKSGIKNIVFYDDALLYQADKNIKPLLKMIIEAGYKINFHTPNGLHIKYLDLELACLMKEAGFVLPRFSLETSDMSLQKSTGGKVNNPIFEKAISFLKQGGFDKGDFIIYLLMGMPHQSLKTVEESIKYTHSLGGRISLSEYSIIPQTKDFAKIDRKFLDEPLYHNKSIYPLFEVKDWKEIERLKLLAKNLNASL
ncbi:MAG: radical SAM protein [Elusimicrobiota bacterium]|jgi:radical SAM superfamily enzyme YgiQ (UPF0313 family)|nr:radical SAM protein [Elusimicrobiota bacterium]